MSRLYRWAADNQNLPALFGVLSALPFGLTLLVTRSPVALLSAGFTACGWTFIGLMAAWEERAELRHETRRAANG